MGVEGQTFVKVGEFVTRLVVDETIVVPIKSGVGDLDSIYTFNEVGAVIWSLVDGTKNVNDIVDEVTDRFEVEPEEARKDVLEFLGTLNTAGLIVPSGGSRG
jgi:hypothetical protein